MKFIVKNIFNQYLPNIKFNYLIACIRLKNDNLKVDSIAKTIVS